MLHRLKRDFGTLGTERIVNAGLIELDAARTPLEKSETLAAIILGAFDDYYARSRQTPWLAKAAFETRDWPKAIELSQERIAIFSVSIAKIAPILQHALVMDGSLGSSDKGLWPDVEARFRVLVDARYEADLAVAYLNAVRRWVYQDMWSPTVESPTPAQAPPADLLVDIDVGPTLTDDVVAKILAVPRIEAPFRDIAADAALISRRVNEELEIGPDRPIEQIQIINAGFYRNRGAYIVGSIRVAGETGPLCLALLNRETGVEVDAVILRRVTLTHVFSSTLANFHVPLVRYHELVDVLHALMPSRPRGLHYSTVGYNHVGKDAVMRAFTSELARSDEPLDHAPGSRGSVAIGFASPAADFVLKVIRDTPTASYKWDRFDGIESVLAKYHSVHELNRSGSMLDNIIYSNILLPRAMFGAALLEDLLASATKTVRLDGDSVAFRHLIVQRKVIPVPLYLATCTPAEAELVVIRLGQCIRNNAATNVFNKDLDGRNYGVSSLRFVYLFDYDALEELTEVKVRTNAGREDGEEDVPEWFFESGVIFLPEELEMHLRLPTSSLRRLFREAHGELLTAAYWTRMQGWLREGRVPRVRTYPRATQLRLESHEANLTLSPPR